VGARPHHNFHVFGVYPWVGLLRSGEIAEPLRILHQLAAVNGAAHPGAAALLG
jgi:hypothetical protein